MYPKPENRRSVSRRDDDTRHLENQIRFEAIENTQSAILEELKSLSGLSEFLRDAKVGIKWTGRVGKLIGTVAKYLGYILAAYGAIKAWGTLK